MNNNKLKEINRKESGSVLQTSLKIFKLSFGAPILSFLDKLFVLSSLQPFGIFKVIKLKKLYYKILFDNDPFLSITFVYRIKSLLTNESIYSN